MIERGRIDEGSDEGTSVNDRRSANPLEKETTIWDEVSSMLESEKGDHMRGGGSPGKRADSAMTGAHESVSGQIATQERSVRLGSQDAGERIDEIAGLPGFSTSKHKAVRHGLYAETPADLLKTAKKRGKEDDEAMYLVASFNNWLPIKMKHKVKYRGITYRFEEVKRPEAEAKLPPKEKKDKKEEDKSKGEESPTKKKKD